MPKGLDGKPRVWFTAKRSVAEVNESCPDPNPNPNPTPTLTPTLTPSLTPALTLPTQVADAMGGLVQRGLLLPTN